MRILIVAYTFPPVGGVGGRRWAKFARYFSKFGHTVEVLTADRPHRQSSSWTADVENIKVHKYRHSYPEILEQKPARLIDKVKYRVALNQMRRKSSGTPFDRALCDESPFKTALNQLLSSEPFDVVVVTGAPFRLLWYTSHLIAGYSDTFFVADFRDPWSWGETWGYKYLKPKKLQFEQEAEAEVLRKFQLITSPWKEIVDTLKEKYPESATRISFLPHGFDSDDLPEQAPRRIEKEKIHLIYGGTLYPDTSSDLEELTAFIAQNSDAYTCTIFSGDAPSESLLSGVEYRQPVDAKDFFRRATNADFVVLFIPEVLKNGTPTKLYELAALGKPILAFGKCGFLSDFIQERALGKFKREDQTMEAFFEDLPEEFESPSWLSEFDMANISQRFCEQLNALRK